MLNRKLNIWVTCILHFFKSAVASLILFLVVLPASYGSDSITFTLKDKAYLVSFMDTAQIGMTVINHEGRYLIVLNKKLNLRKPTNDAVNDFFERFSIIQTKEDYSLIEIEPKPGVTFMATRGDNNNWQLVVGYRTLRNFTTHAKAEDMLEVQASNWPTTKVTRLSGKKEVFFQHEGIQYYAVPTQKKDDGLHLKRFTPFYGFAQTLQGFACVVYSDKAFFEFKEGNLNITTKDPIGLKYVDYDKSILNEVDSLVFDSKGHKEDINQEQRNYEYNLKTDSSRFQPNIQMMRAWYYAATGNGTSTQATLNALMFKFPAIAYHPLFKFITGVAQFQQSEYDISLDYLNMISPTAEVLFWVSQSRGMQERVHMSDAALAYSQELIKNYPEPLGLKIFQTSLQIASQVEDATIMISLLDPKLKMKDETHRAFKQFYTGKLLKLQNKPQEAHDVWVALLRSASDERRLDPRLKVEARFEIIKYEHDMGKIKSEDALEKLEVLRLSWRGDSFEYTITREIVAVQLKLKRYLDALKTLRRIRKLYPSFILLDLIESEMEEVVMSYFRENKNPTNPLQSISIYQEFQDFIPENDEGRAVIIHIADLFEKLDLLEQSAGVLTKLAVRMTDSLEKFQHIIRIANLHITNNHYESAMAILDLLPVQIPPEILPGKNLAAADALIGLNRKDEALSTLIATSDPRLIRRAVDILMSDKNWEEAEKKLNLYVNLLDNTKDKEAKQKAIYDLALVMRLNNKVHDLQILRTAHQELMKDNPVFEILGQDEADTPHDREFIEKQLRDLSAIKKGVESTLKSFSDANKK